MVFELIFWNTGTGPGFKSHWINKVLRLQCDFLGIFIDLYTMENIFTRDVIKGVVVHVDSRTVVSSAWFLGRFEM